MKNFGEISEIISREIPNLPIPNSPRGLYEPIVYTLALGGKRIRPAMVLMATEMFGGNVNDALSTALGIEVFHNFTLLHDDIMDKAPIRRAKPTVHIQWDENTAILSGDVMQIIAYQLIAKTPTSCLKQVLDLFSVTAAEVCEGQQYDMEFETREKVSAEEYLEMIRLKTAVLLACSLKSGAIIGGAAETDAQQLYDFGINVGLAFQLKDDLLDVFGDEKTFGKKIGGDILSNKKTFLLIHAMNNAKGKDAEDLAYWLNNNDPLQAENKIKRVTRIYENAGSGKFCEDKMLFYYEKAVANLARIGISEENKLEIKNLAAKLMDRKD